MTPPRPPPSEALRVLIIEHTEADAELVRHELERAGFLVHADVAATQADVVARLDAERYDIVLSDYRLPGWTAMDALAMLRERGHDTPLIIVTGTLGDERAVDCVKQGVADYVLKERLARLPIAVRRALAERASEERYRLLFESTPLPLWVFDLETHGVLAVNEAAVRHYGYSRDEFLRLRVEDLRPPEDVPALLAQLRTAEEGLHSSGTWRHRKKDGTTITVEITAHGVTWQGRRAELVAANDITERRVLEAQLRQAQKMEAIGRLAGGVAHDFNNLLTIITSYADLLLEDLAVGDSRRDDVEEIRKAAAGAAGLTGQLLAFSRRQVIEPRVLNLNTVVSTADKMLKRLIGEDVELVTVLAPDVGSIKADAGQLEQVIMNLAVNARDAMPQGGKLTIETANVEMDEAYVRGHAAARAGSCVLLAVSDTGVGMNEQTQARIFEPFFTTKEQGKGTGLGLATVYGIVKQADGFIWVYSELDHGTTFKIYLPRIDEPAQGAPARAAVGAPPRGAETVLVVEDGAAVRTVTRQILVRQGYAVLEAPDPETALRLAAGHQGPIHLLVTDVVMPKMNGRALADRLTALYGDVKVLFVSGYTDDAIVRHGVLEPGIMFLQKPFTPDALARKVREVLDRKGT